MEKVKIFQLYFLFGLASNFFLKQASADLKWIAVDSPDKTRVNGQNHLVTSTIQTDSGQKEVPVCRVILDEGGTSSYHFGYELNNSCHIYGNYYRRVTDHFRSTLKTTGIAVKSKKGYDLLLAESENDYSWKSLPKITDPYSDWKFYPATKGKYIARGPVNLNKPKQSGCGQIIPKENNVHKSYKGIFSGESDAHYLDHCLTNYNDLGLRIGKRIEFLAVPKAVSYTTSIPKDNYPELTGWSCLVDSTRPPFLSCTGKVFGHWRVHDGQFVRTSLIKGINLNKDKKTALIVTKNNSTYVLRAEYGNWTALLELLHEY